VGPKRDGTIRYEKSIWRAMKFCLQGTVPLVSSRICRSTSFQMLMERQNG
jgi:hypothetical protein